MQEQRSRLVRRPSGWCKCHAAAWHISVHRLTAQILLTDYSRPVRWRSDRGSGGSHDVGEGFFHAAEVVEAGNEQ